METFGERLHRIRIQKGINATQLANQIGVKQPVISKFENGTRGRSFKRLPLIAKALGCRIDDLFPEMDEVQEDGKPVRADGFEEEKTAGQAAEDGETDDDEWGGFDFT